MKRYLICLLSLLLLSGASTATFAKGRKSKKKAQTTTAAAPVKKQSEYDKLFKDKKLKTSKGGIMTLHIVDDKLLVELPLKMLNRDMMLTALAGPASNLLQAIGWAVVLKLVVMLGISERFVISVCAAGISVNLMLMAFNLIPIPPLDGGRILRGLLPSSGRSLLDRIEPYGMVILVVLMAGGGLGFFARPFLEAGRWLVELVL